MGKRRRKITVAILLILFVPVVGLFLLVLLRTNNMERYLRRELVRRTSLATDGFYKLSFDKLHIDLLNGELSIKGIRLVPDSTVFHDWEKRDSLPLTYVNARIGMIGFKGVNMTWRRDFRKLHFRSFEILKPDIKLYDSYYSSRTIRKVKVGRSKTLYEMISPYIDVLTVKRLNLSHASVSYTVVNPQSPIIYGLQDVSFHAYGFRLDRNSSRSGKLLYCNDFDFNTNKSQLLLTNNDFTLHAGKIRLDTKDSVILISRIALNSQNALSKERHQQHVSTLDAAVEAVTVKGIKFSRENALNYLKARSFDIVSPSIKAYHVANNAPSDRRPPKKHWDIRKMNRDSLVKSLSLYDIISPVLHDVYIRQIGIDRAKMQYLLAIKDSLEVFKLGNFDLHAKDFHIDSMAIHKRGLWYSRCFAFEANDISGRLTARNHQFRVKRLALDTEVRAFVIQDISLNPIYAKTHNDFLSGTVSALRIGGLKYDKGISADSILIQHPTVRYVTTSEVAPVKSRRAQTHTKNVRHSDVYDMLDPFLRYLSVKRFRIDNAEVALNDRRKADPTEYKLEHFNFRVNDILFDEQTRRQNDLLFDYGEIGFDFSRFDNYLPGKDYRLAVDKCSFSTLEGVLSMQNIHLTPQDTLFRHSHLYIRAASPSLIISGLKRLPDKPAKNLYFTSLLLNQPDLFVQKDDGSRFSIQLKKISADDVAWDSTAFRMQTIALTSPIVNVYVKQQKKGRETAAKPLPMAVPKDLYTTLSNISDEISLKRFVVSNALISYAQSQTDGTLHRHSLDTTNISVEGLAISNVKQEVNWDKIRFDTQDLAFPMADGFYTLRIGKVGLVNNNLHLERLHFDAAYPKAEFAYRHPSHTDWFDMKAGSLSLLNIDVLAYLHNKMLRIEDVELKDAKLQNLKNQKIVVQRHVVPMIYAGLYKIPLKVDIKKIGLQNFSVIYEELPKKGDKAGKFYLTGVNGTLTGLTNHPASKNQYMTFDASGRLMDKGPFKLTWQMPLDSTNDLFHLNIHIAPFQIPAMNEFITPLASAEIQSGDLKEATFSTDASSKGATAKMLLLYNDLRVSLLKNKNGETTDNKFLSGLANHFIKHDNPEIKGKKKIAQEPQQVYVTIKRDPYHSTFNYMWQILRPSLAASVGVSQAKQEKAMKVVAFVNKVKSFFHHKKSEPKKKSSK